MYAAEKTCFHPSWIEINLMQLQKNMAIIRGLIGKSLYCLPIKANAYGHGLYPVARAAVENGIDYLAVAHLQEGILLREKGISTPILVLGAIHEDQILDLIAYNLEFTISSKFKADLVASKCEKYKKTCRIHMEVDTGMQRTGVRPITAVSLFAHLKKMPYVEVVGVYSHFAKGGEVGEKQLSDFTLLTERLLLNEKRPILRHIANSLGVTHFPLSYFDMVRPSILTFGYVEKDAPKIFQELRPCFSLKSRISYFKVVEKGQGISYNHTFVTKKRTRIVTIPIGYGDGYLRALSNKGEVLIRGKRFPIVGSICMDQLMCDIGDNEAYVGDEVVLIGKQGDEEISLREIASLTNTIDYEILCLFNNRIPRIYL